MSQTTVSKANTTEKRNILAKIFFPLLIIGTKFTKLATIFKVLKFGKPLVTVISMLISAIAYGLWLGPWFGIGLVAMLFIHEMGHVIALRLKGMETPGPVFIPFLGAAIFIKDMRDRDTEAFIGYGGPLLGTIGALACLAMLPMTEGKMHDIFFLLAYVGVFLNLFNLIPISPLDGGRITQAVGTWFKFLGLALVIGYILFAKQPALLLILILVLDGFDRMTLWLRPAIAWMLAVAMATFMYLGYSGQPFFVDVIDVVLATLFVLFYYARDRERNKGGQATSDTRAYPAMKVRMKWLVCYLGLAALLTVALFYQASHMPEMLKKHEQPTVQIQ